VCVRERETEREGERDRVCVYARREKDMYTYIEPAPEVDGAVVPRGRVGWPLLLHALPSAPPPICVALAVLICVGASVCVCVRVCERDSAYVCVCVLPSSLPPICVALAVLIYI